jgi:uroporphyrinogen-III decarboxylase
MTSRQRLLAAMRREKVDRMPVSLYELHPFAGCWAAKEPTYAPLLALQAERGDTFAFAPSAAALFGDPTRIRFGAERSERSGVTTLTVQTPRGPLSSVSRREPGTVTTWTLKHFIESDEDIGRFLAIPYVFSPPDLAETKALEAAVGESGVLVFSIGDPLGLVAGLCDFSFFVTRIAEDPGLVGELLNRASRWLADTIDWVGGNFSDACVRFWGPEYCGAPLMNPHRHFQTLVADRLAPLVARVHAGKNIAVVHCHGRLDALLEMIVETGADVLEPLEVLPAVTADVSMGDVKRRVGGRMCLAGGIQAADLEMASPSVVRARVHSIIDQGGSDGLIILPTSAPLQVPLPTRILQGYRAMFDEAEAAGMA